MPDEIRFSEFPETKEMKQESVIPIVQSGKNMKIAFENFAKWIGISEEKIAQAVEAYLKENSLETGATQEQVAQINENTLAIDRLYKAVSEKEDAGTAESKVSSHNTSTDSHNDIRLLLQNTINTLNAFLDADEETLNQASEMIAYMKDNRGLIEQVTTNKVSVSDVVDNYTTNVSNKPVSAAVAVKLKALIDAIIVPTQLAQLAGDATHRTVTDAEKQNWNNKADKATTLSGYGITDGATKKEVGQLSEQIVDLSVIITPQMYGAVGDGVTDDTAAFESALAENNVVFVPEGNYLITRTLDIFYKKSLISDDGQRATILYNGSDSVVKIGRMSVFRNINITIKNAFEGIVFDTNNKTEETGESGLGSRVEHVNIDFEVESPNAVLIGITVDSGTDANDIPRLKGVCFQTYHDIHVDNSSCAYGVGIKMELIQGRQFTEETKEGFPWITHIDYDDISLGHPHTAIKSLVTNTSGSELFERVHIGHILFNNIYTQCLYDETTRYFLDLEHIGCYLTKCMPWDYHNYAWNGEKINIIGEGVTACITDCSMASGAEFLKTCDFTTETEYNVIDNPEYFISKYFSGSVLSEGYDSIDAKIDAKLSGEYVANISEEKINEILYSGYSNVMDDPLTQIKFGQRWSGSNNAWVEQTVDVQITTVIIPVVQGGNLIRWSSSNVGNPNNDYSTLYFFNDDELTSTVGTVGVYVDLWNETGGYLQVDNPNGYKYVSIPFCSSYFDDSELENMTMTINREITGDEGKSYTEYLKDSVIDPAIAKSLSNTSSIAYGTCDSVSATAEKVVTVDNENWELKVGNVVMVYFTASNSASNVTLNVNETGAYPIWYNNAEYTSTGTAYTGYAKRVTTYMFNGTHWVWIASSYDSNTTYKNVALGHGYATCSTAAATAAKVGTLSSYTLTTGGIVAVKFTYAVPADSTLNINSTGAKKIFYRGSAIVNDVIKAGDIATFIYDGTQYQLLTIDRWQEDIDKLSDSIANTETWTFTLSDGTTVTKKVVLA